MTAHWSIPDPAAVGGSDSEKMTAFRQVFRAMEKRIKLFLSLPLASLDHLRLTERVDAIGRLPNSGSNADPAREKRCLAGVI